MMTEQVSREEFRMLAERIEMNMRRIEQIDNVGTRGVGVLAVQLQELAKDIAAHEKQHQEETRERVRARRWMIGAAIALVGAIDVPIVSVLLAVHH